MEPRETTTPVTSTRHCAYCGFGMEHAAPVERFGEPFCSDAHAEEFVAGVRRARVEAAARRDIDAGTGIAVPPAHRAPAAHAGPSAWQDTFKRWACRGGPLLLLLALPLFWSGGTVAAAGGSLLSGLALLACPLGMYFMMRAMASHASGSNGAGAGHGQARPAPDDDRRPQGDSVRNKGTAAGLGVAGLLGLAGAAEAGTARATADAFQHVHALAFDAAGRVLWLGAHSGLYRSEDGGATWVKAGLPAQQHGPDVMAIAVHPSDAGMLYVGTHEVGVLKSTDAGRTWTAVNAGLGGHDVHGLAIDPNAPSKLHAEVREKGQGLYRTTDAGGKWVRVDDGPAGETKVLASVDISTGMGGIFLYAGTAEGLLRSPDCF